jgi:hypothetical protein
METSILKSTKKILGLEFDYTAFDPDVITHINAVFGTLHQLGVGPIEGFAIEDDTAEWSDFIDDNIPLLSPIKTYIYLRVKLLFDPPVTSYSIEALHKQVEELEWRINILREDTGWTDPQPVVVQYEW